MNKTIVNQLVLTTSRLVFLPVREMDTYMLHMILTDEYVRRYLYDNNIILLSHTKKIIATSLENFQNKKYGLWLVADIDTLETIGIAGLWDFYGEPQPQLLCALLPRFWKKGYAKEAAGEIIRYAFEELGFNYLIASCDAPNKDSIAVLERLSMEKMKEETIDYKRRVFFRINQVKN